MADGATNPPVPAPSEGRRPIKIKPWARWSAGVVGLGGLGAGGVATFTRDVEAGPVALIAMGMFFFLVAIAGVMPTKLKFGDNEAEFQELEEQVGQKLADIAARVPSEQKAEAVRSLEELAPVAPRVVAVAKRGLEYREFVITLLRSVIAEMNEERPPNRQLTLVDEPLDVSLDAAITVPDEVPVCIEIKSSVSSTSVSEFVQQIWDAYARWRVSERKARLLVITSLHAGRSFTNELDVAFGPQSVVVVRGAEDAKVLRSAIAMKFPVES